jgi:acyl-CoA thioesterase I
MRRTFGLYGALLLLLQGVIACGPAQQPTKEQAASKTDIKPDVVADNLVVVFGDSLYAGYKLPPKDGFGPQLQDALQAQGVSVRVHNAGVSGDTTAAGKDRLNFVLDNLDRKPDLILLGLGGNDMLRGIKPAETRTNLVAMLDNLKKRHIPAILTGILASPNMGPDYTDAFNPIFERLAKQYNVPLYPFFLDGVTTHKALMLNDEIHPNAKGVAVIVKGVEPLVAGVLKR